MEKSREFKIVLSSLAVLFILSFASVYMLFNGKEDESVLGAKDNRMNVKDAEKLQYSKGIPYIFSQPPVSAFVGEKYEYIPRVVDLDSQDSDITLELIDGPTPAELPATHARVNSGKYAPPLTRTAARHGSSTISSYT